MNGGQAALSGFIYQFVGLAGLVARVLSPPVESDDDEEYEAVLANIRDAAMFSEHHDADAVALFLGVSGQNRATIFQFKYSKNPERDIAAAEFNKICTKLFGNRSSLPAEVRDSVRYVLVSNRKLAPTVVQSVEKMRIAPERRTKPWHAVFEDFAHIRINYDTWVSRLRRFARDYGVLDSEFEDGIAQLVFSLARGAMAREATGVAPS